MSNHVYPNDADGKEEWQPIGIAISDTLMDVIMPTRAYQTDLYINMQHTVQGHLYKTMGCARDFSGIISNFLLIG